ncbi:MAG: hypothetical protein QXM53_04245 [Thermofilaceae archaeon]
MSSQDRGTVVLDRSSSSLSPARGLVHALSEIQYISKAERQAGNLDVEIMVPLRISLSFVFEGLYAVAIPMILSFFTIPIMVAVFTNSLPAFGSNNISFFDKVLVFFLSASPGVLKSLFIAYFISGFYLGKVTRQLLVYFVLGSMVPFTIIFSIVGFFVYQFIYLYILVPASIEKIAINMYHVFNQSTLVYQATYKFFSAIRGALPKSSILFLFYGPLEALILLSSYYWALYRTKKIDYIYTKWHLRNK